MQYRATRGRKCDRITNTITDINNTSFMPSLPSLSLSSLPSVLSLFFSPLSHLSLLFPPPSLPSVVLSLVLSPSSLPFSFLLFPSFLSPPNSLLSVPSLHPSSLLLSSYLTPLSLRTVPSSSSFFSSPFYFFLFPSF